MCFKQRRGAQMAFDVDFDVLAGAFAGDGGAVGMFADMPHDMPLIVAAVAPPLAAVEPLLDAAPPIRRVFRGVRKTLFEKRVQRRVQQRVRDVTATYQAIRAKWNKMHGLRRGDQLRFDISEKTRRVDRPRSFFLSKH